MLIPNNVILPFAGLHSAIPTNWTRETTLDNQFIKAWGTADPSDTGGASSHSHTGIEHTHTPTDSHGHTVAVNADSSLQTYGGANSDPIAQSGHDHPDFTITTRSGGNATDTIAYPSTTNNNHPPYYTVIFIKAGSGAVLPDGALVFFNSATIPDGYLLCSDGVNGAPALGNKYLRGADTDADAGDIGGSLTHTHDLTHSHSTSHSHSGTSSVDDNHPNRNNDGGSGGHKMGSHTHSVTLNSATVVTDTYSGEVTSGTVEPAFKKLIALYVDGGIPKKGIIGLWLGNVDEIPQGWLLCNGQMWSDGVTQTPDLRNYFIKCANATGEIGATGGSNTHSHSASNSHTHTQSANHNHTGSIGTAFDSSSSSGSNTTSTSHGHTISSVGNNNATLNWGSASMSAESVDNQPEHTVVAFIQLEKIELLGSNIIDG